MYNLRLGTGVSGLKLLGFLDGDFRVIPRPGLLEKLQEVKGLGFDTVEVSLSGPFSTYAFEASLDEVIDSVIKSGMKVSFHMPFGSPWIDLATPYDNDRSEICKWLCKIFKRLEACNPFAFVFHPGGQDAVGSLHDKAFENLCISAEELSNSTKAMVCIENMVRSKVVETVDQMLMLLEKAPSVNCVLDVNHLLHDKPEDAIVRIGERIKHLHISDYDFINERHMLPGNGLIDWMAVIGALEKIGYEGVFNYEVSCRKFGHTVEDIKNNKIELFEKYNSLKK